MRDESGVPQAVDRSRFQAALDALRVREKAHTQEGDAIAAARRLTLGEVNYEPSIVLLNQRKNEWEVEGIIRLDLGADGRAEHISDYQHCPWILTAGSIVVRGSID